MVIKNMPRLLPIDLSPEVNQEEIKEKMIIVANHPGVQPFKNQL